MTIIDDDSYHDSSLNAACTLSKPPKPMGIWARMSGPAPAMHFAPQPPSQHPQS